MLSRPDFEAIFGAFAKAPVGTAGDEEQAVQLMKEAFERLESNPGLFTGDPNSAYTYDDPILANIVAFVRAGMDAPVGVAGPPGADLRNRSWSRWALVGVHAWLSRGDRALVTLGGMTPTRSITLATPAAPVARLAIVGDAGYAGLAQQNVIEMIRRRHQDAAFDLIVHLGDTYFGGSEKQVLENLLAPFRAALDVQMVTLCGNHDLYYGPDGYIAAIKILRQPGRYVCVETPNWRIACLDTALAAERVLRDDGMLDDGQLAWLDDLIERRDGKGLILMGHHVPVSSWGKPTESLLLQLAQRVRSRVFAWYWGHEHSCAAYAHDPHGFYGACVGNGAFRERCSPPHIRPEMVMWYAQGRCECFGSNGPDFWPHGFLELELHPNQLVERYHIEGGVTHERFLARE
ncbi:MAG: metallophosphoesterase [Deltaproteobacteria bacterium]|nr:metallophosphoesterase [Deltaproteobacteria bacterium]